MPAPSIEAFAKRSGKTVKEVETLWDKAKKIAQDEGRSEAKDSDGYYAYVTGILKKMLKIEDKETMEEQFMGLTNHLLGGLLEEDFLHDDGFLDGTPEELVNDVKNAFRTTSFIGNVSVDHREYYFKDGTNRPLKWDGSTTVLFVPKDSENEPSIVFAKQGKTEIIEIPSDVRWRITGRNTLRIEFNFSNTDFTFINMVVK